MTAGTVVGRTGDVPDGEARRFDVDAERVCVVHIGDEWFAIGDTCSHAEYSLSEGDVWADECEIECPKHGAMFSLRTGEPLTLPATRPVPTYSVRIDGDNVVVAVKEGAES
ncbi:MAG TPA: non-heme iron oxygenase ferredoxin subunit [Acidimicrobiia bacterium]|jgi:3-phenylpropionate/trans-cinnamate dioxygenase ferredoxin subunit